MAFDFPSSPTVGQVANGYVWNGTAWAGNGNLAAVAPPSDTPPGNPVDGQLWWDSSTGNLFLWFVDDNSGQWVQINGAGISDAPQDGNAYTRINGIWRLSEQNIPVTGGGITVPVPSWASRAELTLTAYGDGTDRPILLRVQPQSEALITSASYATYGDYCTMSSGAWTPLTDTTSTGIGLGNSQGSTALPGCFTGDLNVQRANTTQSFTYSGRGTSWPAAGGQYWGQFSGSMNGGASTKLRLDAIQIGKSGSFGANSNLRVRWS